MAIPIPKMTRVKTKKERQDEDRNAPKCSTVGCGNRPPKDELYCGGCQRGMNEKSEALEMLDNCLDLEELKDFIRTHLLGN